MDSCSNFFGFPVCHWSDGALHVPNKPFNSNRKNGSNREFRINIKRNFTGIILSLISKHFIFIFTQTQIATIHYHGMKLKAIPHLK
ncbi:hypothetical protein Avbf_13287 [Armadillidium vulgare]|nr:hypothetical protein Avbf_13287 [Armadillidium vulgare]